MKLPFLGDWAQTSINSDPASPLSVPDSAAPYLAVHAALKGGSGRNTSRKVQQRREAGQMKRSKEGDPGSRSGLFFFSFVMFHHVGTLMFTLCCIKIKLSGGPGIWNTYSERALWPNR